MRKSRPFHGFSWKDIHSVISRYHRQQKREAFRPYQHYFARTERAKFAVGYFFLSGFEAIKHRLKDLKELRLLIGNTTNQATLEQLSEGFKRLELKDVEPYRQAHFHFLDFDRFCNFSLSPTIKASFLARDQCLICDSRLRASEKVSIFSV